ncbi:hypothetical protein Poli38472_013260 [Pythium oligandrum]|uniref:Uncharacterized protein n=1 Tax=Pythium oligandrum TaxID=41045 RepID=A0A8K1C2T0_PYTOL|nr:hypothetical protein Poli38472_013260 [Pythium oligandrum]|eukprot:TMW55369.1 hypothetical protein Poli38472_013260 [Pythium oligandrum]
MPAESASGWRRDAQARSFASSSPPSWRNHWEDRGYAYMLRRGWGITSRVMRRWNAFEAYYKQGVFAKETTNEERSRMFVLTCMPTKTQVDLFEFLQGATHAVHAVYDELYTTGTYPVVVSEALAQMASEDVLQVFQRKPQRQTQQLAVHAEPRQTRLVLEQLDIERLELIAVDYTTTRLADQVAADRGYEEEERLRLDVVCDVTEHVRVVSTGLAAIDDHSTFQTTFKWSFASNVSESDQLDWTIVDATEFTMKSTLVTANK